MIFLYTFVGKHSDQVVLFQALPIQLAQLEDLKACNIINLHTHQQKPNG
jgi:hypothetical protein